MASRVNTRLARHLEAVADLGAVLAVKAGVNPCRVRLAAHMHDWLKPVSPARLAGIMAECGETMDCETGRIPAIWHGHAAAALARHRAGMRDREILEAVKWHSTGRAGMSAIGEILFVSDFCSKDRRFPEAAKGRRLALRSLRLGVRFVLASRIAYLLESGVKVHASTLGFWGSLFREVAAG